MNLDLENNNETKEEEYIIIEDELTTVAPSDKNDEIFSKNENEVVEIK
jgi:hypothetical protein